MSANMAACALNMIGAGRMQLRPDVQNIDAPRSLNFTFEVRTPPAAVEPVGGAGSKKEETNAGVKHAQHAQHELSRSIIEEGLWWKHDAGVEGFVAITNISATAVPVALELLGTHGEVSGRKRVILPFMKFTSCSSSLISTRKS